MVYVFQSTKIYHKKHCKRTKMIQICTSWFKLEYGRETVCFNIATSAKHGTQLLKWLKTLAKVTKFCLHRSQVHLGITISISRNKLDLVSSSSRSHQRCEELVSARARYTSFLLHITLCVLRTTVLLVGATDPLEQHRWSLWSD